MAEYYPDWPEKIVLTAVFRIIARSKRAKHLRNSEPEGRGRSIGVPALSSWYTPLGNSLG